jgi:group II intron reverse transcriptase/maturase
LQKGSTYAGRNLLRKAKPFYISKREVFEAYKRVKANRGAAGVDNQTLDAFDKDLKNNLYKIWNRMCSGSYFPPPIRRVEIPKDNGGKRPLGIPTVSDRIAQMVVKRYLEQRLEPHFHADSYGYRPGKAALDAVGKARERCWRYKWVLDLDIKGFFDNIDHELLMKAVRRHTDSRWVLLYIQRWLKAPVQLQDGSLQQRVKGTPQGAVISPLLANLFLHYVLDKWMQINCGSIPFERYADDVICHCTSQAQARWLLGKVRSRLGECRLELNIEKTKIVYCKGNRRRDKAQNVKFDFLGFTFQPRGVMTSKGHLFVGFNPGISQKAAKAIRDEIRSWHIHLSSDKTIEDLSRLFNPKLRGWVNYYGSFYRSVLYKNLRFFSVILTKWAMRKYKRFRGHQRRAGRWLNRIRRTSPHLFAHWQMAARA